MGSICNGSRDEGENGAQVSMQRQPEFTLPCEYKSFKLIEKTVHTHNTRIFKFSLESPNTKLGLPIGKHVMLKFEENGNENGTMRPYTPISDDNAKGYFLLLIKIYDKGKMGQYLDSLSIKDTILMSGAKGRIHYNAPNNIIIDESLPNEREISNIKHIGMIAGGTGITPMYQVIKHILTNKENDTTKITLLFANHCINDVLLKNELETLANENNKQFNLYFTVTDTSNDDKKEIEKWNSNGDSNDDGNIKYSVGRIDKEMIEKYMPKPSDACVITLCGPPKMIRDFTKKVLPQIGYDGNRILKF